MSAVSNTPTLATFDVLPHAMEAEQSVLGGLLLDNSSWELITPLLCAADFYLAAHQIVFRAIQQLAERNSPFDVLLVSETLKLNGQLDIIGGELALFELVKNTPSAVNIVAYATVVQERSILRQLILTSQRIAQQAHAPRERSVAELLDEAQRYILQITERQPQTNHASQPVAQILRRTMDRIDQLYHAEGAITGISTGYKDLDAYTSGLQPAELIVIAGRPSMGKTTFAMNIAEHVALHEKKPVLVFSMEMPAESLGMRLISSIGLADQQRIRTGKLDETDWSKIQRAASKLSQTQLFINDMPALTPSELRLAARRLFREHGQLGLIVVDYLQLMRAPGFVNNRVAEISEISRTLKTLAKELHVPVIALSQLNRGLEQRNDKRPQMSDLRESGAIEQDADLILFIYRDEVYNPDSPDKGCAEIIIAKQRNGPIGKIKLTFRGQYTRFENYMAASPEIQPMDSSASPVPFAKRKMHNRRHYSAVEEKE